MANGYRPEQHTPTAVDVRMAALRRRLDEDRRLMTFAVRNAEALQAAAVDVAGRARAIQKDNAAIRARMAARTKPED